VVQLLAVLTTLLGVGAAIIGILGGIIPYLMARKDKELIQQDKDQIRQDKVSVAQDKDQIQQDKALIELDKGKIEKMLAEAHELLTKIQQKHTIVSQVTEDAKHLRDELAKASAINPSSKAVDVVETEKPKGAGKTIQKDPNVDMPLKLRAEAVTAGVAGNSNKAYALWRALTELTPTDSSVHFHAGCWAQNLSEKLKGDDAMRWLKQAEQHYEQALAIKSDMNDVAYNWGNTLYTEANTLVASDLPTARSLWQKAGEKFQQALAIKPDKHEAAINWGTALHAEARALTASDLTAARSLWQKAGEKFQQALIIKSDKHVAFQNWGIALDAEASALAASDLPTARGLWQKSIEKYQQALAIKPDDISSHFNLACAFSRLGQIQECCAALAQWRRYNSNAKRSTLDSDSDFDQVRNAPEFLAFRASLPE
jgi:tetratricopeptide (TPR) repeat protein